MARIDGRTIALLGFDVAAYAVACTVIVVTAVTPIGYVFGGWVSVKIALFLVGTTFFGYSTLRLWLRSSGRRLDEEPDSPTISQRQPSRIQRALDGLPGYPVATLPPESRISPSAKLFVASVLVLFVSFAMETVFGVGASSSAGATGAAVDGATESLLTIDSKR